MITNLKITLKHKVDELRAEFQTVLGGRNVVDSLLPPLLFVPLNAVWGVPVASAGALGLAGVLAFRRYQRGESALYAGLGIAGVLGAAGLALLSGQAASFFLPSLTTAGLTLLLAVGSNLVKRPMVAWTSALTRRWPWEWYWHPQVRPAYSEVTWLWAGYFGLRLALQYLFFQRQATASLALVNFILGWPGIAGLLVVSYLYGTWRLRHLNGPSVDEFKAGSPPPWEGQQRGF